MEKFNNKYRIPSARLQNWDYGTNAMYFITVCTQNREHYFGEIENNIMQLSHTGILANVFWHEIPNHAPNVSLGAFVVMPNHVHGILILERVVETRGYIPEQPATGQQQFQNQGKNTVSSIVGSYKSAVTKHANRLGLQNGWQPRFHDHIIRNDDSFLEISNYIINNPSNWQEDQFYKTELSERETHR